MQGDLLKNWDLVGQCYDILKVDLANPVAGQKYESAFDIPVDDDNSFVNLPDKSALRPKIFDYQALHTGAMHSSSTEIACEADYKHSVADAGSVTVSDPTGSLFSGTLSASYNQVRQETSERKTILTFAQTVINLHKMKVRLNDPDCRLGKELKDALNNIQEGNDGFNAFFDRFGTHFAVEGTLGGTATQKISIVRDEYVSFLEENIDVKANAEATIEVAKAKASGDHTDNRSERFRNSRQVKVDDTIFVGGEAPQGMWDMWSMNIYKEPGLIAASFTPLYELATPKFLGCDEDLAKRRREMLKAATEAYLRGNGRPPPPALNGGQNLSVTLAGDGPSRYLLPGVDFVTTSGKRSDQIWWRLESVNGNDGATALKNGGRYRLRHAGSGKLLNAQAGHDTTYPRGEGLVGTSDEAPDDGRCEWELRLVGSQPREEIIDGDLISFKCAWSGAEEPGGVLLGEADSNDREQRVYAFGKQRQPGAIWVIATS